MSDQDHNGSESARPPNRKQTLRGMPSAPPSSPPEQAPARPAGKRVTLSFSGPPLSLPEEGGEEGDLELDTGELGDDARSSVPSDPPDLDLDLDELQGAGDAWSADHRRRSSPPPAPGAAPPGAPAAVRASPLPPPPPSPPEGPESEGDALGLVDRSRNSVPPDDLASEMRERYALDDFTGALRAAELLLGRQPGHAEAQRYAESSRHKLEQHYSSRLGGAEGVPVVTVKSSEVRWLGLDHRAGFLLSRIDGETALEDVLDMSGMPRLEALKMLAELLDAGAIRISVPHG